MKNAKQLLFTLLFLFLFAGLNQVNAQTSATETILKEGSIEEQFNHITEKSRTYNDYKVIKLSTYKALKQNVFDTLKTMKADAVSSQMVLSEKNAIIDSLASSLSTSSDDLETAVREKNSLAFLGIKMNKSVYNSLMWAIVLILMVSLILFVLLYKRSHVVTVRALSDLEETRDEFETHRKRALERQEEVVRKYHAELNKVKSKTVTHK